MEELFKELASAVALALEALSVLVVAIGGLEAAYLALSRVVTRGATQGLRRQAWLGLARWLLLGLEFMLAADIVRTVIAPTWQEIGQLAAIALVPLSPHIYEGLPLLLLARSRREMLLLSGAGMLGLLAGLLIPRQVGPQHNPIDWLIVLFSCYLPALLMVLRRPNRTEPGVLW